MANSPNLYGEGGTSDDATRNQGRTAKVDREKMGEGVVQKDPLVARYWREIERYERATTDWYEEGDQIVDVYLDQSRVANSTVRRFALLWANVETLKPAVYVKVPTLTCSRRFKDKDPIAKVVAEVLERAGNTTFDLYNVDETFRMVRDDRLLPGRGQAWVRYEATIEKFEEESDATSDDDDPDAAPVMREKLKDERVCVDHVRWKDFGHNVCQTWNDVWLAWRIVYKTKDEVEDRFGAKVADTLSYTDRPPNSAAGASSAKDDPDDRVKIYEMWDKKRGIVSWMAKGRDTFLESEPPHLEFRNFFPCPEPCYATKTSKEMIPRPDYRYYRDQAKEINDLTEKIGNMTEWLVVKGFIPGGPSTTADPIEEAIRDKGNKELFVTVDSWSEWSEKGGANKLIDWLPLDMIVKALQAAISARNQLIQDVFQITGISDILRGQTDPNETLGAQELKAQTGTKRLRNTKDEVARFTRDIGRLCAEVIAQKFAPETLARISGYKYQPLMPMAGDMGAPPLALPAPPQPPVGAQPLLGAPMGPPPAGPPAPAAAPPMQPPIMGGPPAAMPVPQPAGMAAASPMGPPPGLPVGGPAMPPGAPPSPFPGAPPANPLVALMGHNGGPGMFDNEENDPDLVFDERHMQLMRDDQMRNFRIDIETDSTVQADENAEKQARVEFTTAVGAFMQQWGPLIMQAPELTELAADILLFLTRGYRAGRSLEESIENTMQKLQTHLVQRQQQAASQPPPHVLAYQAQAQAEQMRAQTQQQNAIADSQIKVQAQQADTATEMAKLQTEAQLEIRKQNVDAALANRQIQATATAQAQDRIAKALMSQRPMSVVR